MNELIPWLLGGGRSRGQETRSLRPRQKIQPAALWAQTAASTDFGLPVANALQSLRLNGQIEIFLFSTAEFKNFQASFASLSSPINLFVTSANTLEIGITTIARSGN